MLSHLKKKDKTIQGPEYLKNVDIDKLRNRYDQLLSHLWDNRPDLFFFSVYQTILVWQSTFV